MRYSRNDTDELWWCNSHQRQAEYIRSNRQSKTRCCDPKLGGILLPCNAVNLTGIVEIDGVATRKRRARKRREFQRVMTPEEIF